MKVTKEVNQNGKVEIRITLTNEDATLTQTAILQFAEKIANCKAHQSRMRILAMLIDKQLVNELTK